MGDRMGFKLCGKQLTKNQHSHVFLLCQYNYSMRMKTNMCITKQNRIVIGDEFSIIKVCLLVIIYLQLIIVFKSE